VKKSTKGGVMMSFRLNEKQKLFRQMVSDFAKNEVKPLAAEIDRTEEFPAGTVRKMAD